jgi:hypothetical protein
MSQGYPGYPAQPPTGGSGIPNPYGPGAPQQPYGATPPNPYGSMPPDPYGPAGNEMPRRSRTGCWIGAIFVGLLTAGFLICAGCLGFGYFAIDTASNETAVELKDIYSQHPLVKKQVGEVQEVTYNWNDSFVEEDDNDIHVYDVRGTLGTAQFVIRGDFGGSLDAVSLRSSSGEVWDLSDNANSEPAFQDGSFDEP